MGYYDLVRKAQEARKLSYGYGKVQYVPCELWQNGNQINLWSYWHGYQLEHIGETNVDILLVGQDWGNHKRNAITCERIKDIQSGINGILYNVTASETDRNLIYMFKAFGEHIDITKKDPGMRLFFTNYSLGYRTGSETGGMTKRLMKMDAVYFDELVMLLKPRIIICLGKITYEVVTDSIANAYSARLREGIPWKSSFAGDSSIPVYGVAHCGSRGRQNVGGIENMRKAWDKIAEEFKILLLNTTRA